MCRGSLLPLGTVGAGEACDLLIFRLRFKCLWKDRSLVALGSSYRAPTEFLQSSYRFSGSKLPRHKSFPALEAWIKP